MLEAIDHIGLAVRDVELVQEVKSCEFEVMSCAIKRATLNF